MRKELIIILTFLFTVSLYSQDIVINEIMSLNSSAIEDDFGDVSDWVEIYNNSSQAVSLTNWYLSDDPTFANKWQFPDTTLQPSGFILVFCSNRDTLSDFLHTNFKLDEEGETLVLSDNNVSIIDIFFPVELIHNISYGRITDGSQDLEYFYASSPGSSNSLNIKLNDLTLSHDAGFYTNDILLELELQDNNSGQIYYTVNGNDPIPGTSYTHLYEQALSVLDIQNLPAVYAYIPTTPVYNSGYPVWQEPQGPVEKYAIIKARGFDNGNPVCHTKSNSYFINSSIEERFIMPVLSIIIDSASLFDVDSGIYIPGSHYIPGEVKSGNYSERGKAWEKPATIEYFSTEGELLYEQDLGLRIHGNLSRSSPQKGIQLFPGKEYDGKNDMDYPFFENRPFESYKRIIGRSIYSAHNNSIIRDEIVQEIASGLDVDYQEWQAAITFVNGEYWGIQVLREKQNEYYLKQHYDINTDSVDIIGIWGVVENGTILQHHMLNTLALWYDLTLPQNYEAIQSKIDFPAYIDYYITEIFFNNRDWPGNNFIKWRPHGEDNKWRWFLVDLDDALVHPYLNNMRRSVGDSVDGFNPEWSTFMFRNIMENPDFQEDFLDRIIAVVNNEFKAENTVPILDKWEVLIEDEVDNTIDRWGIIEDVDAWKWKIEDLRNLLESRPCILKDELQEFFNISYINIECDNSSLDANYDIAVKVSPNPVLNKLRIVSRCKGDWRLYSSSGTLMNVGSIQSTQKGDQIDFSGYRPGMYILMIRCENEIHHIKIIKS